jgi:hypothetical protein
VFKVTTIPHICCLQVAATLRHLQAFINLQKICERCIVTVLYDKPQQNGALSTIERYDHEQSGRTAEQPTPVRCIRDNLLTFRFPSSRLLGGGCQREQIVLLPKGAQRCGKKICVSKMSFFSNKRPLSHFFAASEKLAWIPTPAPPSQLYLKKWEAGRTCGLSFILRTLLVVRPC